jgi:hypothetical protein
VIHRSLPLRTLALLAALAGCAGTGEPSTGDDVAFGVRWPLVDPAGALPDDVFAIRILLYEGETDTFQDTTVSVTKLSMHEGRRVLNHPLLRDLPRGEPLRITIEGLRDDGSFGYVGHAGPFVLEAGARRYVDLQMYSVGASTLVDASGMPGRFLHATAPLPDGAELI